MTKVLLEAHRQWASRPPYERFANLNELLEFTGKRMQASIEDVRQLKGLRLYGTMGGSLTLNGSIQTSLLTNWAFTQLCQQAGAPAGYLKTLTPEITVQCLEYGINTNGDEAKILIRRNGVDEDGKTSSVVSAFTSPAYVRIRDHEAVEALMEAIENQPWHTPPSRSSERSEMIGQEMGD